MKRNLNIRDYKIEYGNGSLFLSLVESGFNNVDAVILRNVLFAIVEAGYKELHALDSSGNLNAEICDKNPELPKQISSEYLSVDYKERAIKAGFLTDEMFISDSAYIIIKKATEMQAGFERDGFLF